MGYLEMNPLTNMDRAPSVGRALPGVLGRWQEHAGEAGPFESGELTSNKKNPLTPCLGDEYYSRGRGLRERVSRCQGRMLRGVIAAGTWIQGAETWPCWSRCSGLGAPLGAQHLLTLAFKASGTQARERVALPCPPPGNLPDPGIKPRSPALQVNSLPSEPPGKPYRGSLLVIYFIYTM